MSKKSFTLLEAIEQQARNSGVSKRDLLSLNSSSLLSSSQY